MCTFLNNLLREMNSPSLLYALKDEITYSFYQRHDSPILATSSDYEGHILS